MRRAAARLRRRSGIPFASAPSRGGLIPQRGCLERGIRVPALAGLPKRAIVLFGFPDTLWEPQDGFVALRAVVEEGSEVALGVFNGREPERSDAVVLDEAGTRVASIHVKEPNPPGRLVWGCLAARAGALDGVAAFAEPGHFLDGLARAGRVAAVDFGAEFFDVGTPEALAAAGESV